jgi:hypothetical protein
MSTMKEKLLEFWKNNETKIVFLAGLVLVALISFQGGYLKGKTMPESPLVIERPAESQTSAEIASSDQSKVAINTDMQSNNNTEISEKKNCAYVGSKNSTKYHLPSCRYAKTIKPENLACFASKEDAQKRGYQPDANCLK